MKHKSEISHGSASDALPLSPLAGLAPLARLRRYVLLEGALLRIIAVYSAATGLLSLAVPVAVQVLINTIAFRTLLQPVAVLAALLLLALAASAVLHVLQLRAVELVGRRFVLRVVADLFQRVPCIAGGSNYAHRFFEIAAVDKAAASLLFEGLAALLQIGAAMLLLAVYHPSFLGFAALLALTSWVSIRWVGRGAISSSLQESSAKYALADHLAELERGSEAVNEARSGARSEQLARAWVEARDRHFSLTLRQQIALLTIGALFSALLLFVGGRLVIDGQLSLGQLVAAELVTAVAVRSLAKLGQQLPKFYDLVTALEKIGLVVDRGAGAATPGSAHGGTGAPESALTPGIVR